MDERKISTFRIYSPRVLPLNLKLFLVSEPLISDTPQVHAVIFRDAKLIVTLHFDPLEKKQAVSHSRWFIFLSHSSSGERAGWSVQTRIRL